MSLYTLVPQDHSTWAIVDPQLSSAHSSSGSQLQHPLHGASTCVGHSLVTNPNTISFILPFLLGKSYASVKSSRQSTYLMCPPKGSLDKQKGGHGSKTRYITQGSGSSPGLLQGMGHRTKVTARLDRFRGQSPEKKCYLPLNRSWRAARSSKPVPSVIYWCAFYFSEPVS